MTGVSSTRLRLTRISCGGIDIVAAVVADVSRGRVDTGDQIAGSRDVASCYEGLMVPETELDVSSIATHQQNTPTLDPPVKVRGRRRQRVRRRGPLH